VSTVAPNASTSVSIVCAAMVDTPGPAERQDRFLIKAATPSGDVMDEAAFWKAGPPGPCASRKFGVALVEKIVEGEEYETETEDDTTSSMTMLIPAHQLRAAAAQTSLPAAEHTVGVCDDTVTWSTPGKSNLQHDADVAERNSGEETRLRSRVVALESAVCSSPRTRGSSQHRSPRHK
jgi:hypothetical protein